MTEPARFSLTEMDERRGRAGAAGDRGSEALPRYDHLEIIAHCLLDVIDLWRDPRFVALFAGRD